MTAKQSIIDNIRSIIGTSCLYGQYCYKPENQHKSNSNNNKILTLLYCLKSMTNDDFKYLHEQFVKIIGLCRDDYDKINKIDDITIHLNNIINRNEIYIDFNKQELDYWLEILATFEYVYNLIQKNKNNKTIISSLYSLTLKIETINIGCVLSYGNATTNRLKQDILKLIYRSELKEYVESIYNVLNKTKKYDSKCDGMIHYIIELFKHYCDSNDTSSELNQYTNTLRDILKDIIFREYMNTSKPLGDFISVLMNFGDYVQRNYPVSDDDEDSLC